VLGWYYRKLLHVIWTYKTGETCAFRIGVGAARVPGRRAVVLAKKIHALTRHGYIVAIAARVLVDPGSI